MTYAFADAGTAARLASRMLLEVEAVNFRPEEPYRLTSGLVSPVYVDCRRLISFPRVRGALMDLLVGRLIAEAGAERFAAVAGGETAGIPFAAFVAERTGLPMLYVRKAPKGFGRGAQIEGWFPEGANVLLVEDLATDGGSKLVFVEALRAAGAVATDAAVVFFYDVFPGARARLAEAGIALHALATWRDVLAAAREDGAPGRRFAAAQLDEVEAFLGDPYGWSAARGGIGAPG